MGSPLSFFYFPPFVSNVLLHTLALTLQGGSITAHNKHPVFGSKAQEVSVYCYWACVSHWIMKGRWGVGQAKMNNVDLISGFPFFDCSLNKGRRGQRRASPHRCLPVFFYSSTQTYIRIKHTCDVQTTCPALLTADALHQMQYHKQARGD